VVDDKLSVDDTPSEVELVTAVVADSAADVEDEMAASLLSLVEEGSEAVCSLLVAAAVESSASDVDET